jgi:hypothetical protein
MRQVFRTWRSKDESKKCGISRDTLRGRSGKSENRTPIIPNYSQGALGSYSIDSWNMYKKYLPVFYIQIIPVNPEIIIKKYLSCPNTNPDRNQILKSELKNHDPISVEEVHRPLEQTKRAADSLLPASLPHSSVKGHQNEDVSTRFRSSRLH